MQEINFNNITTDVLQIPAFNERNIEAAVLRLDKIHPIVSGNKWFKLRYYLEEAKQNGKKKIITFGGAWSNHIIATAVACSLKGFESTGIIRGEEAEKLSSTLTQAKQFGMKLIFISRGDYRVKNIPNFFDQDDYYVIPEGGYGTKGMEGASTILDLVEKNKYTHICCAAGTGTMAAGLLHAGGNKLKIIAISVLKNYMELDKKIHQLQLNKNYKADIIHDYHFGGYAKYNTALINFMNEFYRLTAIPSDLVYTGKLFFAIHDLVVSGYFPDGSKILVIHSGGLQGNASLSKGTLIF
jgi:1-aminocyclopropane-1-carboxylate deaminase